METTAFFEKKISLTPSDFNKLKNTSIDELLLKKAKELTENKCSEHGFILSGSLQLISRSMGYFEAARFTGDANYYVKLEARVIYPIDGVHVTGQVIRKNKMGLYVNYNDAIRIQVPRDLHLDDKDYDDVEIGDEIVVEIKRSKFAINDSYILSSGLFINNTVDKNSDSSLELSNTSSVSTNASSVSSNVSNLSLIESNTSSNKSNTSSNKSNTSSNTSSLVLSNVSNVYNSSSSESNSNEELEVVDNSGSESESESNVSSIGSLEQKEANDEEDE